MGKVTAHPPGNFCWMELATSDIDAAERFYAKLFGWQAQRFPMGADDVYVIFSLAGAPCAAAYRQTKPDVPPFWNLYVCVSDVDAVAARVGGLGGTLLAPPFDVMRFGRMAVVSDPGSAPLSLWQPREHIGFGVTAEPGTFCWAELLVGENGNVAPFYTELLGWKLLGPSAHPQYLDIVQNPNAEGHGVIAGFRAQAAGQASRWLPSLLVSDCNATAALAAAGGGKILMPRYSLAGQGYAAMLADPQGAAFNLFQLDTAVR